MISVWNPPEGPPVADDDDDRDVNYCQHGNYNGTCPYCESGPFGDDWGY